MKTNRSNKYLEQSSDLDADIHDYAAKKNKLITSSISGKSRKSKIITPHCDVFISQEPRTKILNCDKCLLILRWIEDVLSWVLK